MIKPTPTKYNGHSFRSRLEARWAVYFDCIGIEWWYEMEGYQLPSGWYLPDFWLPQVNMFAEVKPTYLTKEEFNKAKELAVGTGFSCILLEGVPSEQPYRLIVTDMDDYFREQLSDCVLSMYRNYPINESRFYCNTGFDKGDKEPFRGRCCLFDDVGPAVLKAKAYRF